MIVMDVVKKNMLIKSTLHEFANVQLKRFRKRRPDHGKYVGASEIGLCERRIWYAKQEARAPLDTKHSDQVEGWGATRRGATFEKHFWLPAMKARFGENLLYASRQITMKYGYLRATPDGILIGQPRNLLKAFGIKDMLSNQLVTECKTVDPRVPLQTIKVEHEFQAQIQLGMFNHVTQLKPQYALVSYTNASFYDDVIEFVVKYDPIVFEHAQDRAQKILAASNAALMKPEGWLSGGKECAWCKYKGPCDAIRLPKQQDSAAVGISPQDLATFVQLGTQEREIHTRISGLQDEQRNLQEQIKSRLRELSLRRIDDGGITITWSAVVGRPAWDMPALRAAAASLGLDIQKFERVGEPSDRLTITLRKLPDPGSKRTGSKPNLENDNVKRSHA